VKSLKVIQINCASFGSTGSLSRSIHKALLEAGHESKIYYGIGSSNEELVEPVSSMFSVHIHSILSRYTGMQGYFSVIPTLRLIRKIKKFNPDVIHLHNVHGSYINLSLLFKFLKKYNKKTVITLHDCWLFTGKCPYFTDIGCTKWLEGCGNCSQLQVYPKSEFIDRTRRNLKDKKKWLNGFENLKICTVSDWLRDTAKKSFLSQYPIVSIHNGIDANVFYPRETEGIKEKYCLDGKFMVLGVASSWDKRKGLDEFISLAKELPDIAVVLVGLRQEQTANLPENIIAIQRTENRDELAELYSAADVFINLSTEETFGLVVAEAMSCGTPAIVYNSTACPEIVEDGVTGFVVEPHNLNAVIKVIGNLNENKTDFSENCRRHIINKYTVELMCKRYLEFYDEL